jgi:hypothetical protein
MRHRHLSALISAGLVLCVGAGTFVTLLGVSLNTSHWDLITPSLAVGSLLAFGLGSVVFTPARRRP